MSNETLVEVALMFSEVRVRRASPQGAHHFFGYYDKSPWSVSGQLLAHRSVFCDRLPRPGEAVEIGTLDPDAEQFTPVGQSTAWNLQQGTMLQWLTERVVVFNDFVDGRLAAVALNIDTGQRCPIGLPVAALSQDGRLIASISFGRLQSVKPEYGYAAAIDPFRGENAPSHDGLWLYDVQCGDNQLLVGLSDVLTLGSHGGTADDYHYFNHPLFSPDAKRIVFVHRYIQPSGLQVTRLLCANTDGSGVCVLVEGMASHYCWLDDRRVLAWAGERKALGAVQGGLLRRIPIGPVLKTCYRLVGKPARLKAAMLRDSYTIINVCDQTRRVVHDTLMSEDGHCTVHPLYKDLLVTDTYPDGSGVARLIVGDLNSRKFRAVAEFRQSRSLTGDVRCDLHPRWHPVQRRILVDSSHEGERQMYIVDLDDGMKAGRD